MAKRAASDPAWNNELVISQKGGIQVIVDFKDLADCTRSGSEHPIGKSLKEDLKIINGDIHIIGDIFADVVSTASANPLSLRMVRALLRTLSDVLDGCGDDEDERARVNTWFTTDDGCNVDSLENCGDYYIELNVRNIDSHGKSEDYDGNEERVVLFNKIDRVGGDTLYALRYEGLSAIQELMNVQFAKYMKRKWNYDVEKKQVLKTEHAAKQPSESLAPLIKAFGNGDFLFTDVPDNDPFYKNRKYRVLLGQDEVKVRCAEAGSTMYIEGQIDTDETSEFHNMCLPCDVDDRLSDHELDEAVTDLKDALVVTAILRNIEARTIILEHINDLRD